jgi:ABC-2 type transport system ATP-binding protein
MTALLETRNLVKHYKSVAAVQGVSLTLEQGVCFGLLGPNGAGKTTVLEVIEDIIEPTSGEVLYKGSPRTATFSEEVGIQFQHTALLNYLKVSETLQTFQSLYQDTYELPELIELCNLTEILNQYNDKISGGQRQRLLLALALINQPELLFLDEPSTGLDPQARRNLWSIVQNVRQQGKTVFLTTHSMEEAEYLCDEIAIMDHGRIIAQGAPAELIKQYCGGVTVSLPSENLTVSRGNSGLVFHEKNGRVEIQADDVQAIIKKLLALDVALTDMTVRSPNLEDVFLNLTGRQLRE